MITQPDALSTWSSSSYLQSIAESLKIAAAQNIVLLEPAATGPTGTLSTISSYSLYLTGDAVVALTTAGGQSLTVPLKAGYQPLRLSAVSTVTGATGYALY